MEHQKDYNLLRPFDLEAAKRGEKICTMYGNEAIFIGTISNGRIAFETTLQPGEVFKYLVEQLRMAPLAWVEGRPVYKGDVLYHNYPTGKQFIAEKVSANAMDDNAIYNDRGTWLSACELTWQKPKTKREGWVNVYPTDRELGCRVYGPFANKSSALASAADDLIDTVPISWEE